MSRHDLATVLGDASLTWTERRTRLQGWQGPEAELADQALVAQRVGAAACAVGAAIGAALESPVVLAAVAATALVGAVAANHPFEVLYNRWARSRGGGVLPANRAAKRLGCAIGVVLLGGAAFAYAMGASTAGLVLAAVQSGAAAFVAVTGICVPSIIFTVLWGLNRARAPSLVGRATAVRRVPSTTAGPR
jgi:hypothetical protein